ncbi:hypothetical protein M408DRAFT_333383 [Serendipita vermifera MAFF 305830]|uniref:C2H2-type domain-containing protein n=1 Tax=Serendipita vermifera MAFF 305830 TaxID=933852 RepID=A0A0C2W549_SERVB|nr:hypothetical protein M408DRAFT_333383 [Serendipita vermifera MAFF 305830]
MEAISDRLLKDPTATEQVLQHPKDIKDSNSALHTLLEEAATQLSAMAGVDQPCTFHEPVHMNQCAIATDILIDTADHSYTNYVNGVLRHLCTECGTPYDRKSRASDCRNIHLGFTPYKCLGQCGFGTCDKEYASRELLIRHCGNKAKRCHYCHKEVSKQNFARHLRGCSQRVCRS